jgi:hypothetical protein
MAVYHDLEPPFAAVAYFRRGHRAVPKAPLHGKNWKKAFQRKKCRRSSTDTKPSTKHGSQSNE